MAKLDAEKTFSFIYFFLISRHVIILYIFVALVHHIYKNSGLDGMSKCQNC